ncbi:META domain-containing protein [Erwinia sp. AnSW2-5]|uniref:META domain-containing protein n=1 Tax=Erwinia sp. AnSW2-5 TaxID=3367692 RepID=UPI00385CD4B0
MKKTMLLLLGAVALNGCSQTSHSDAGQLANRLFALSAVDGQAVKSREGMKPGIGFNESLSVSGVMCNRFFGQGQLEQGRLIVPMLASTRMQCNDPLLNKWEQTLSVVLKEGAEVKLTEHTLTLTGSGHTLEYTAQ